MIWSYNNNETKLIFSSIIMYTDLAKSLRDKTEITSFSNGRCNFI